MYAAERSVYADQLPSPQLDGASDRSTLQQPARVQIRDQGHPGTSSAAGLPRRGRATGRPTPEQAWPAALDAVADPQGVAQSEAERAQDEADRLAQIRRELPDWRQERDAPLYNTPYKEYRLRRH